MLERVIVPSRLHLVNKLVVKIDALPRSRVPEILLEIPSRKILVRILYVLVLHEALLPKIVKVLEDPLILDIGISPLLEVVNGARTFTQFCSQLYDLLVPQLEVIPDEPQRQVFRNLLISQINLQSLLC